MAFFNPLDLRDVDGRNWIVLADLVYQAHDGWDYHVPRGFKTDLASIPQFFWRLFPKTGEYDRAAVLHDWLYTNQGNDRGIPNRILTKPEVDLLFLEAMESLHVPYLRRNVMYWAVRLFGQGAWDSVDDKSLTPL